MRIVGHRGAPLAAPENTLAAFSAALALGVDAVEFDVHRTADEKLVVIHDDTVDRTTNGVGRVDELTLADIQRLKIERTERVPSLEEVLDLCAGKVLLHVEIKAPAAMRPAIELLSKRGFLEQACFSSFWHRSLLEARDLSAEVKTGALFSGSPVHPVQIARDAKAGALHLQHSYITPELVAEARAAGLSILAWTVDSAAEVQRLAALGIDDLVTNDPSMARKVLDFLAKKASAPPREKTEDDLRRDAERAAIQALMKAGPGKNAEGPREQGKKPAW